MEKLYNQIYFSSDHRSSQEEIMDDFNFQGAEMEALLSDLERVNKWLGGNKITLNGIAILLRDVPKNAPITIVDLGCGDGELLRQCAHYGSKFGYDFKLIGIDANEHILSTARKRSIEYQNITYQKLDVTSSKASWPTMDIVLCTLFLHHFSTEGISSLLENLSAKAKVGIVINDLERSKLAFRLFQLFSRLFLKTNTARFDGLVSIARGFKQKELTRLSENIKGTSSFIKWRWAFRYQWILKKE